MNALIQNKEIQQVHALLDYAAFNTSCQKEYDDIIFLAALVCDAPISFISVFNSTHQRFKAKLGLQVTEAPLENSFCSYTITQSDKLFIVPDALADARFTDNTWVTSEPNIRFYVGVPLITQQGNVLGTLCVMDSRPRTLTDAQKQALHTLSRQAISLIESDCRISALQESEMRFKAFMDNSPVLASLKDEEGRYVYTNRAFLQLFGLQLLEVLGKTDFDLWPANIANRLRKSDLTVTATGKSITEIETVTLSDGQQSYWQVSKFMLDGERRLLGSMSLEITGAKRNEQKLMEYQEDLKKTLQRLEVLSITDSLTELYNRRAFDDKLTEEFERARRYNLPLSLLLIDVDHFKEFNDSLGHSEGDELLRSIALILKNNARANDLAARYGGDEFAVILPNTGSKVAFSLAERLRWITRKLFCGTHQVTLSIGVAAISPNMKDRSELIIAADKALYDAKRKGRNQVSKLA